jgi:FkbM family methyltransferase
MNLLHQILIRPYIWHELPAWGWLYARFIGDFQHDSYWKGEKSRTIRGKLHGYTMDLDISHWSERQTYFLGRSYDLDIQLLQMRVLRPGDRFVDIGANIGMVSLLASRLVGPDGIVDAVEPNPRCAERIRSLIACNRISNIRLHNLALADSEGILPLSVPRHNSGEGTLTSVARERARTPEEIEVFNVPVRRGDDVLSFDPKPPILIKIDVEGFERQVLTGLDRMLNEHEPLVVAEVGYYEPGRMPPGLFEVMESHGYSAYAPGLRRKGVRQELTLEPVDKGQVPLDVVWVPRSGGARERLRLD